MKKKLNSLKPSNTAIICLSPTNGGMEMNSFQLAKMLSTYTNVTLIVKKKSAIEMKHKDEAVALGINFESISFIKNISFSIIFGVRKIITKNKVKNVIFFGASELKSLYFSFLHLDINFIIEHSTTKSSSKKDLLHRLIYSKVNYHVAICQHIAKNVKEIIPFGKDTQLTTIYSSLRDMPDKIRTPEKCINRPIILLHVARIADGKGQIDAIKACHTLHKQKKDFILYLVGDVDEKYQDKFMSFLKSVPYKNSIKLEGFTSNVADYYRKSDIFIFPSKGEGLSNSFMEALSYGLICITYKNTSFPELKDLGFDFYLAENLNIESLENSLKAAITHCENTPIPLNMNIGLAKKLFSESRELKDFLNILM